LLSYGASSDVPVAWLICCDAMAYDAGYLPPETLPEWKAAAARRPGAGGAGRIIIRAAPHGRQHRHWYRDGFDAEFYRSTEASRPNAVNRDVTHVRSERGGSWIGSAVVTRLAVRDASGRECHPQGTAGLIVRSPAEPRYPYRVRFPGGDEASLKRQDLEVLKRHQRVQGDTGPMVEHDLWGSAGRSATPEARSRQGHGGQEYAQPIGADARRRR